MILGAVLAGYSFPQRFISSQEEFSQWLQTHPFLGPWGERLGLDHIYTTPWFALLLLVFLLTLLLSTAEQVKRARAMTFGPGAGRDEKGREIPASDETIRGTMGKAGYLLIHEDPEGFRFVKHPWGYWGNVLLHLGIVFVIGASLALVVTETRGLLQILTGETHLPSDPWLAEETGMLGKPFVLPEAVRLDRVEADYWETDDVKHLETIISFIGPEGKEQQYPLGVNRTVNDKGLRIYQGRRYGDGFYVTLTDGGGREINTIFQMEHPFRRNEASYGNFDPQGVPYRIKAKYFANAERQTIRTLHPLLVMRLVEGNRVIAEVSLKVGESGAFGPYTAKLVHVSPWSEILFVRSKGMSGIFVGFVILIMGSSLTYFMPPRECVFKRGDAGYFLSWKAPRFEKFYEEEFYKISEALGGRGA